MNKKAGIQLSVNFLVMLIIAIVVFGFSIYIIKQFFTGAEKIRMTYDERTEKEIERLLDDGSRIAIPFDKKTIHNEEFKTFGIGILNMLKSGGADNEFKITIGFNKAFNKDNTLLCGVGEPSPNSPSDCGNPDSWLQTTEDTGAIDTTRTIKKNEQEKFLLGVGPKGAEPGTYIFDMKVCVKDDDTDNPATNCYDATFPDNYDPVHKIYVEVP